MPKEPLMTEYEIQQSGVQKILEYFDDRLTDLRLKNDNPKAHRSTRGRIAEIKSFNEVISPNKHDQSKINKYSINY